MSSFTAQAQAMVGPKPPGDPGEMLEGAGQLLSLISELESQASAMERTKPAGSGPFIAIAAAASISEAGRLRQAAARLQDAASSMRKGAADVKEAQHRWATQVKKVAGQLEHEMRRAQSSPSI